MSDATDWNLVARAQSGDSEAFAALVRRYQTPVIHFCQRMVGSLQDAEDLAQESFVRLYRYLPKLRPGAKFSTVLFGIARNLTLNAIRDANRRGRGRERPLARENAYGANQEWPVADERHRPDRDARVGEIGKMIARALEQVTPEHREVLVLRELQGLDYDAIAQIVRTRKGTVKSRLARAREQLRARIIELGGEQL